MKEILPTKRFDKNFKEVYVVPCMDWCNCQSQCEMDKLYNQAQQRKVLVPLSEFEKLDKSTVLQEMTSENSYAKIAESRDRISNYNNHITQPITEQSLDGVEWVVCNYGEPMPVKGVCQVYMNKTIEHAINDGVLFILKD